MPLHSQVELLANNEEFDRKFETKTNTTTLHVKLSELNGDKKYSVTVKGRTVKGFGETSEDKVTIETPKTGKSKIYRVKDQNTCIKLYTCARSQSVIQANK